MSNYDDLLRDQINVEKVSHTRKNNMISDDNSFVSKLCATANEHGPNELNKKNKDNHIKVTNCNNLIQPKKWIPMT